MLSADGASDRGTYDVAERMIGKCGHHMYSRESLEIDLEIDPVSLS